VVRRDVVAAKGGRARGWLNDAAAVLMGPLDAFVAVTPCSTTNACTRRRRPGFPPSAPSSWPLQKRPARIRPARNRRSPAEHDVDPTDHSQPLNL